MVLVSVSRITSETTTSGQSFRACRTLSASGILTTGLVAMIQIARMRPSATASNISTAFSPGCRAITWLSQKRYTASAASKPLWAARVVASSPTSRPPMAWLAGDGERATTGLAHAPANQVAVEDGVDLVGAGAGLVDAL